MFRRSNQWTAGWAVSGIARFSTGFPVTLFNNGDTSLLGTEPNGVNDYGVDLPNYTPGPLNLKGIREMGCVTSMHRYLAFRPWAPRVLQRTGSFIARAWRILILRC